MTRCVYGSDRHTIVMDDDLTDLDDTATHQAVNQDRPSSVVIAVCGYHADWLHGRGWSVTALVDPS